MDERSKRIPAWTWLAAALLAALVVAGRLLPHPPNFTPTAGVALFAGFLLARSSAALGVTWGALLVSDAMIGFYHPLVMLSVYACLGLPVVLRRFVGQPSWWRVAGCAAASSVVFFAVTNFAVWAATPGYGWTLEGLARSYVAAIPFFKYTLAGDLLWSLSLFGSWGLAVRGAGALRSVRRQHARVSGGVG